MARIKKGKVVKWTNKSDNQTNLKDTKAYRIDSLGGDDNIFVTNEAANTINGGSGNDTITVKGDGNNQIQGEEGEDTIRVIGDGDNTINGGEGVSTVTVGHGKNKINTASEGDTIHAGGGSNIINAGEGNNIITAGIYNTNNVNNPTSSSIGIGNNKINTGAGNDTITTGDGNDQINAGEGDNIIDAGGGKNAINTGAGADRITIGSGSDRVHAGEGNDTLFLLGGNDFVQMGGGDDVIELNLDYYVGGEKISLFGDAGFDKIAFRLNKVDAMEPDHVEAFQDYVDFLIWDGGQSEYEFGGIELKLMGIEQVEFIAPVLAVNDAPIVSETGSPATLDVLANDWDLLANYESLGAQDNRHLTIVSADQMDGLGSIEVVDNKIVYTFGDEYEYLMAGETETVKIKYIVKDNQGFEDTATATVTVTGVNQAPTSVALSNASVIENAVGATIGTLTGVDPDVGDTLTFSVVGSNSPFEAVKDVNDVWTLRLKSGHSLNYETASTVNVDVRATDTGNLSKTQTFTINVGNVNEAPTGITVTNQQALFENTASKTFVADLEAVDPDLVAGFRNNVITVDDARFEVENGKLYLKAAQSVDYESLTNGKLSLTLTATDATNSALTFSKGLDVTVTNVNEAPAGTDGTVAATEDQVYTFTAADFGFTDPLDHPDNALHSVIVKSLPAPGTLKLDGVAVVVDQAIVATDIAKLTYQSPLDANGVGYASFTFQVRDDGGTANGGQDTDPSANTITINVAAVNDPPTFTSSATPSVIENSTAVVTLTTSDVEGSASTFTITGGADHNLFEIVNGNELRFKAAPNFEAPGDAGTDNVYDVQVTANDGTDTTPQSIAVTVTNVNEAPAGTNGTVAATEDQVYTFSPADFGFTDPLDAPASNSLRAVLITSLPTFGTLKENGVAVTLTNGVASISSFNIDKLTYQAPLNAFGTSYASFTFRVRDDGGTLNGGQNTDPTANTLTIDVAAVNDPQVFTSSATPSVAENVTAAVTLTTSDIENDTPTFTITGGADEDLFEIVGNQLRFKTAPNFEIPADAGANNVYDVQVTAADGPNNTVQTLTVTVTDVNEAPAFTSSASPSVAENGTAAVTLTASDAEGATLTYSITGGADAGQFSVNATTGALSFLAAPDFELPADADANNVYDVQVAVTDGVNQTFQSVAVTVTDTNEAPVFTSSAAPGVFENGTAVATLTATDQEGNSIQYSITGGADAGKFSVNATTGALSFASAPDFEVPGDADSDNVYDVQVTANDGTNNTVQTLAVTVANVNEAPEGTSQTVTAIEDQVRTFSAADFGFSDPSDGSGANSLLSVIITSVPLVGTLKLGTTTITAGDVATGLEIPVADIGTLTYEPPLNANGTNYASFQFKVRDNGGTSNGGQDTDPSANTITIDVTPVNDAPVFTSSATPDVPENSTKVVTLTTYDVEGDTFIFEVSGGLDQGKFKILGNELHFISAPDFETPNDLGGDSPGDNIYDVQVTAVGTTATQNLAVKVTDVDGLSA
ncbi:MAG TPA: hypothetical protein VHL98_16635 [Microvirga sp.]|jgi:hypothetical protein|nr:hypothetical protein [Microvirga sp.]